MIPIKIKYKIYPFSEKATRYSRSLNILLSWPMKAIVGFVFFGVLGFILSKNGVGENIAYSISAGIAILAIVLLQILKRKLEAKIEKTALLDLKKLKETNFGK